MCELPILWQRLVTQGATCPRCGSTLRALGRDEVQSILAEHGVIVVQDEICNREYHFDADDVARLFDPKGDGLH